MLPKASSVESTITCSETQTHTHTHTHTQITIQLSIIKPSYMLMYNHNNHFWSTVVMQCPHCPLFSKKKKKKKCKSYFELNALYTVSGLSALTIWQTEIVLKTSTRMRRSEICNGLQGKMSKEIRKLTTLPSPSLTVSKKMVSLLICISFDEMNVRTKHP